MATTLHGAMTSRLPASNAVPDNQDGQWLFFALLVLIAIEYAGLANLLPILKVTRAATLLAWGLALAVLFRVGLKAFTEFAQNRLLFTLVIWTGASVLWAIVRSYVPETFRYMLDYFAFFAVVLHLVDRPSRIRLLAVVVTLVLIFNFVQNLGAMAAGRGGNARFSGAYFMGDGNDFAWAYVTLLLFPVYLSVGKHRLLRLVGAAGVVVSIAAIVATQSRGASLALAAAFLYYWIFLAKRKVLTAVTVAVLGVGVVIMAPPGYVQRMNSIQEYDEDSSAQGRIRAWRAGFQMSLDYPLGVGAGNFSSAYGRYYRPDDLRGFGANRWISAHSVYFKILGEYGLGGVAIWLTVIFLNLRDNQRHVSRLRATPSRYPIDDAWPAAVNLGLVGYAVGGIFLGGVTYPHLFFVTGLTLGCRRIVETAERTASDQVTPEQDTPRPVRSPKTLQPGPVGTPPAAPRPRVPSVDEHIAAVAKSRADARRALPARVSADARRVAHLRARTDG